MKTTWNLKGELPSGCIHHGGRISRDKAAEYLRFRTVPNASGIEYQPEHGYRMTSRGTRQFELEQKSSVYLPKGYTYVRVYLYGLTY